MSFSWGYSQISENKHAAFVFAVQAELILKLKCSSGFPNQATITWGNAMAAVQLISDLVANSTRLNRDPNQPFLSLEFSTNRAESGKLLVTLPE